MATPLCPRYISDTYMDPLGRVANYNCRKTFGRVCHALTLQALNPKSRAPGQQVLYFDTSKKELPSFGGLRMVMHSEYSLHFLAMAPPQMLSPIPYHTQPNTEDLSGCHTPTESKGFSWNLVRGLGFRYVIFTKMECTTKGNGSAQVKVNSA